MITRKRKSESRYQSGSFNIKKPKYKRSRYSTLMLLEELEQRQKLKSYRQGKPSPRVRFNLVHEFVSKMKARVGIGFQYKLNRSFNLAIKQNLQVDLLGEYPDQRLDYPLLCISKGKLATVEGLKLVVAQNGYAQLSWDYTDRAAADDSIFIMVFNLTKDRYTYVDFAARRLELCAKFYVGKIDHDDELHCWVFLKSFLKKDTSNSQYVHNVTITPAR